MTISTIFQFIQKDLLIEHECLPDVTHRYFYVQVLVAAIARRYERGMCYQRRWDDASPPHIAAD